MGRKKNEFPVSGHGVEAGSPLLSPRVGAVVVGR